MSGGVSLSVAVPAPHPPSFSYFLPLQLHYVFVTVILSQFNFHRLFPPLSNRRLHLSKQAHPFLIVGFCSGYYHMIISDGQLATKMFHYERGSLGTH